MIFDIQDYNRRDQEAFRLFFSANFTKFFNIAFDILQNDDLAKDVVIEKMKKIFDMPTTFDTEDDLQKYTCRAVQYGSFSALKKAARERKQMGPTKDIELVADDADVETELGEMEIKHILHDRLLNLPPVCQRVMKMLFLDGLSHQEIAEQLRISKSTVANHRANGLAKLRGDPDKKKNRKDRL